MRNQVIASRNCFTASRNKAKAAVLDGKVTPIEPQEAMTVGVWQAGSFKSQATLEHHSRWTQQQQPEAKRAMSPNAARD
jgi:hypothetical protein